LKLKPNSNHNKQLNIGKLKNQEESNREETKSTSNHTLSDLDSESDDNDKNVSINQRKNRKEVIRKILSGCHPSWNKDLNVHEFNILKDTTDKKEWFLKKLNQRKDKKKKTYKKNIVDLQSNK